MRDLFRRAGIVEAETDARVLAEEALGLSRLDLLMREREPADPGGLKRFEALAARRIKGEPVARILGRQAFWSLDFALNAATLVPRPETEMLVRQALDSLEGRVHKRLLDLGTGSGCIAIAALKGSPSLRVVAVDLSGEALKCARANAATHGVAGRFETRAGSWYGPLAADEVFDVIVSNPPYIESAVIEGLMTEVREHDPRLALDGGPDGLDAYRTIAEGAGARLKPDGALIVEIGAGQAEAVRGLVRSAGFRTVQVHRDLAGLDRMVLGTHLQD